MAILEPRYDEEVFSYEEWSKIMEEKKLIDKILNGEDDKMAAVTVEHENPPEMKETDVELDIWEAELKFLKRGLENLKPVVVVAVAVDPERNATMEDASAAVQAAIEQKNDENRVLFNVLDLCVCAGFDSRFRIGEAKTKNEMLMLATHINKRKKVKIKFNRSLAHGWFGIWHRWKMKRNRRGF